MTSKASFLEPIDPATYTPKASDYLALLIFEQPQEDLSKALSRLQPHGKYKIGVINRASTGDIAPFLEKTKELRIPLLFVQPRPPAFHQLTHGQNAFSVNIVSPGSALRTDLAAQFITHPQSSNVSWIGYQTYLTPPELLAQMQARYFSPLRLGSYRENPAAAEPYIRHNHLNLIDLTAIRHSDAPDGLGKDPNGLYAEEVCQLAHYTGLSSRLEACYIYGYPKKSPILTRLVAQILWHLFESLSTGQNEDPCRPDQQMLFTTKEVHIGDKDHILHFLYSNQTGRWWIRLGAPDGIFHFFPCTQEEYEKSLKGELPTTWLRHYQKMFFL